MKKKKIILITVVLILLIPAVLVLLSLKKGPSFTYETDGDKLIIDAHSNSFLNRQLYICIDDQPDGKQSSNWQPYTTDTYELSNELNYIHIKDSLGNIADLESGQLLSININNIFYPLYPIGAQIDLNLQFICLGDVPVQRISFDPEVAVIENDAIITKAPGTALIRIGDDKVFEDITITVTDLYTLPEPDSSLKPFLTTTICDSAEAKLLDEVLALKISEAGYQTRAGVVAAARFLALEFPYKLAYFSESGRLDPTSRVTCDGEGRYYHQGLYLSEDKYADISASVYGPKYWGLFFREDNSDDHSLDDYYLSGGFVPADIGSYLYLSKRPNGLDCSGHVSWCYLNGGFDFGDLGAGGPGSHGMSELGEFVYISDELLQSDRIKAGDLIGCAGHIGIVIGVDEQHIWISDANTSGLKNTCFERNVASFEEQEKDVWKYFMLMDSEYLEDGNYTPMW